MKPIYETVTLTRQQFESIDTEMKKLNTLLNWAWEFTKIENPGCLNQKQLTCHKSLKEAVMSLREVMYRINEFKK